MTPTLTLEEARRWFPPKTKIEYIGPLPGIRGVYELDEGLSITEDDEGLRAWFDMPGNHGYWSPLEHIRHADPAQRAAFDHAMEHRERDDLYRHIRTLIGERDAALRESDRLRAQLPAGMEHCTFVCKHCERGHAWLTAKNWTDHGCPICELDDLRTRIAHADAELAKAKAKIGVSTETTAALRAEGYAIVPPETIERASLVESLGTLLRDVDRFLREHGPRATDGTFSRPEQRDLLRRLDDAIRSTPDGTRVVFYGAGGGAGRGNAEIRTVSRVETASPTAPAATFDARLICAARTGTAAGHEPLPMYDGYEHMPHVRPLGREPVGRELLHAGAPVRGERYEFGVCKHCLCIVLFPPGVMR
jgi:hypothetical protein